MQIGSSIWLSAEAGSSALQFSDFATLWDLRHSATNLRIDASSIINYSLNQLNELIAVAQGGAV